MPADAGIFSDCRESLPSLQSLLGCGSLCHWLGFSFGSVFLCHSCFSLFFFHGSCFFLLGCFGCCFFSLCVYFSGWRCRNCSSSRHCGHCWGCWGSWHCWHCWLGWSSWHCWSSRCCGHRSAGMGCGHCARSEEASDQGGENFVHLEISWNNVVRKITPKVRRLYRNEHCS